ncbi:MAG: ATP-binding cassette domain-containing protein, partial [Thermoplasmata archaeon]
DIRAKSPKALSGGQKQRLVIASILTMGTETIVLDEAFSMLDQSVKRGLLETLKRMSLKEKMTVVVTSQDAEDIYRYCDKMILLDKGRLAAVGKPSEILTSSQALTSLGIEPPQVLEAIEKIRGKGTEEVSARLSRYFRSQLSENRGSEVS